MSVSGTTTQGNELQGATDLRIAKGGRLGFGEGTEFASAVFDDVAG